MNILLYNDLNTQSVKKVFDKVVKQLQNNDFAGAEVKKMQNTGYCLNLQNTTIKPIFYCSRLF